MPRPPVLEVLDWKSTLDSAHDFEGWLSLAGSSEQADRMRRALERQEFDPGQLEELGTLSRPVHVLAFAEDWCGDVIRHVPVLEKMARVNANLRVRYCKRDEHPDVFLRFLTNGGEAIPKFVFLSEDFVECGNWGPMQDGLRDVIARGKACNDVGAARKIVANDYQADPGRREVVRELLDRIAIASAECP